MKNIATDTFSFEKLITKNGLYVDKTRYVWKLVSGTASTFFLSRPRRFGKSLLLSTFKAYFEGKRELFSGLEIEKLKTDEWEKYPVIHLDLAQGSSGTSFAEIVEKLKTQVRDASVKLGVEIDNTSPSRMLHELMFNAFLKYNKKLVILIDEYDKPILDSMYEPYIDDVMKMMADFYQELKSANEMERFVFITGVTKFAHVSLFSGANNPVDLTRSPKYATMLGYTEKELRDNFGDYIDDVAEKMRKDRNSIVDAMRLWYNGTRFVSATESVYNPVSVGRFFEDGRFSNYWVETGTPRMLLRIVKNSPFRLQEMVTGWEKEDCPCKYEIQNQDIKQTAIQAGFLSIVEWKERGVEMYVRYDFPNKEIRDSWYSNIITLSTGYSKSVFEPLIDKMYDALDDGNLEELMTMVSNFFSGIPYENAGEITEGYFRNQMHTLFTLFGIPNQCEVQQASQRVDIVAQTRKMAVVFEAKMLGKKDSGKEEKVEALLDEAEEQVKKNGYAEKYRNESEVVRTVAVVFDGGTRKLLKWRKVL